MKTVLDIETTAYGLECLSESQQEYILRSAEQEQDPSLREEKREEAIRYLSLYPFTAKVIAIGMLNAETENSYILFESAVPKEWENKEKKIKYRGMPENEMLEHFWSLAKKFDTVITFNGRNFDIPFLMLRSAVNRIKPTINFTGNRYDTSRHIDLLEQLTFYGQIKKFNLDFYCRSFGIESPKRKGVTGMEIKELYSAGRIEDIAIYCAGDIRATFQLYKIWRDYLNFHS